jgi:SAM-dependent methyltransferase
LDEALDAHTDLIAELARVDESDRVVIQRGDALALRFPDHSFDAIVCLEAAGDICVTEADKTRLVGELFRILRPGGHVGFSDLALRSHVSPAEDRELRAVLYHSACELVTDWPSLFVRQGFQVIECLDLISDTLLTWDHVRASTNDETERLAAATATGWRTELWPTSSASAAFSPLTGHIPRSLPTSPW